MAFTKFRELAVVVGTYTDNSGQTKNRYENVGSLLKADDGSLMIMLKATFNPAGVPREPGRESILVSCFEPRDRNAGTSGTSGNAPAQTQQARPRTARQGNTTGNSGTGEAAYGDSDIPF